MEKGLAMELVFRKYNIPSDHITDERQDWVISWYSSKDIRNGRHVPLIDQD